DQVRQDLLDREAVAGQRGNRALDADARAAIVDDVLHRPADTADDLGNVERFGGDHAAPLARQFEDRVDQAVHLLRRGADEADRLAIEQILSNLIENATKYLKPGRPGVITVSGHEERGRVLLSVADNGRGIDTRDHARVFDLFRRSGAQDQPGEGIGLAHVRALAYRLGGTIDLTSELGEGATFRLNLPKTLTVQDQKA
ncbi:MAG: ATP-binding protein, partial [Sphingomonas sp.]